MGLVLEPFSRASNKFSSLTALEASFRVLKHVLYVLIIIKCDILWGKILAESKRDACSGAQDIAQVRTATAQFQDGNGQHLRQILISDYL